MEEKNIILLALSTNRQSKGVIEFAVNKAKSMNADLIGLFVVDPEIPNTVFTKLIDIGFLGEKPSEDLHNAIFNEFTQQANKKLNKVKKMADENNVNCEVIFTNGKFDEESLNYIQSKNVSLVILMRSKRSKWARLIFGSAVDNLLKKSPCPVKVVEEC